MNRIKDYSRFAACFVGLGYIVLWPITANEMDGEAFGASIFCRDGSFGLMDFMCSSPYSLLSIISMSHTAPFWPGDS